MTPESLNSERVKTILEELTALLLKHESHPREVLMALAHTGGAYCSLFSDPANAVQSYMRSFSDGVNDGGEMNAEPNEKPFKLVMAHVSDCPGCDHCLPHKGIIN